MKLTVVIPNRNMAHYLEERIPSILSQLPPRSQLIFVDDASTDRSVAIAEKFASQDPRVSIIAHKCRQGIMAIVNQTFKSVQSEFLCFEASDDITLPGFYQQSVAALEKYPQAPLSFCDMGTQAIDEGEEVVWPERKGGEPLFLSPKAYIQGARYEGRRAHSHTSVYRVSSVREREGYLEDLKHYSDSVFNFALCAEQGCVYCPEPLFIARVSAKGYGQSFSEEEVTDVVLKLLNHLRRQPYRRLRRLFRDYFFVFHYYKPILRGRLRDIDFVLAMEARRLKARWREKFQKRWRKSLIFFTLSKKSS